MINKQLAKHRNLSNETIKDITSCQKYRSNIIALMKSCGDKDNLRQLYQDWVEIEYKLQELWGFSKDPKRHKFWNLPQCTCPKMDNDDMYPYGMHGGYYISEICPMHNSSK